MFLANQRFIFIIFSAAAPIRGQPAAKCHPRWQPTRRLAVSCGLGRRQIQTRDCRTTVWRATIEPPCLPIEPPCLPMEPPCLPIEPPCLPILRHHAPFIETPCSLLSYHAFLYWDTILPLLRHHAPYWATMPLYWATMPPCLLVIIPYLKNNAWSP